MADLEDQWLLLPRLTAVVREADAAFERAGGGTRHWVRDCFLPVLAKAGLAVVPLEPTREMVNAAIDAAAYREDAERFLDAVREAIAAGAPASDWPSRAKPHGDGWVVEPGMPKENPAEAGLEAGNDAELDRSR